MTSTEASAKIDEQQAATAAHIIDRLSTREESNKAEWARRREEAEEQAAPEENVDSFLEYVTNTSEGITSALSAVLNQKSDQSQLDGIATQIQELDGRVAAAAYYLPSYELRSATARVAELRSKLDECRAAAAPKRKFAFSKKVNRIKADDVAASSTAPSTSAPTPSTTPGPAAEPSAAAAAHLPRGAPASSPTVRLSAGELAGRDYIISGMDGCTILVDCGPGGPLPMLRLQRLRGCRVQAGPVAGATFVDDVCRCEVMLATYQVRIHTSLHSDFYLRTRSRPIIELSSGLRFGPFSPLEPEMSERLEQAQLGESERAREQWRDVDDFGWIKAVQSPNWQVLDDGDRQPPLPMLPAATADA